MSMEQKPEAKPVAAVLNEAIQKARAETREYVWKYWAFHADQRLRTFNFFILVVTVLIAGFFTYLKDARYPAYACPAGFLLSFICYVFWRLDCRNRALIQHAEGILKSIETGISVELVPDEMQLFVHEDAKTDKVYREYLANRSWRPHRWWHAPLSFYRCFRSIFIVFGLFGLALGTAALFLPGQPDRTNGPPPAQNFFIGGQPTRAVSGTTP
jgi:hypothetical protein